MGWPFLRFNPRLIHLQLTFILATHFTHLYRFLTPVCHSPIFLTPVVFHNPPIIIYFWKNYKSNTSSYNFIIIFMHNFRANYMMKSSFSEKATKVWKNLPLVLTLLSENNCFVKTSRRFFQNLWPSHNVWTLKILTEDNGHFLAVKIVVQKLDTISISILKLYTYFWREKM